MSIEDEDLLPKAAAILNDPLLNGVGFDQAIKDMGPAKLKEYMEGQYAFLQQHYEGLRSQLDELTRKVRSDRNNLVQRIERILLQMTHHMTIIRQMIDIVSSYGDRITAQEREMSKRETEHASLVERQNRFAISLAKLEKNSKEIVEELDDVRQKEEAHSKLEWRVMTVFAIGAAIVAWLLTGDHFAQILHAIGQVMSSHNTPAVLPR